MKKQIPVKVVPGYDNSKPGIQVATKFGNIGIDENGNIQYDKENITLLHQMGIEWVMVGEVFEHSADSYTVIRQQVEELGFKIWRLPQHSVHNMPEVTLNLPGRDKKIAEYLTHIENLGKAGIYYDTYAHMGNSIWRSDQVEKIRGGGIGKGLKLDGPKGTQPFFGSFTEPYSHGREYSEDEIWENYEYFIKQVVPVAESSNVTIGIHPDDPPVYTMAGVPRCAFGTFEGYKRAMDIANSPNIGVCLCVGCWLEGGELMGATAVEAIEHFGKRNQLKKLHVRNVTAPLSSPNGFVETYPDAGYGDLSSIVKALDNIGFDGCIMNDHLVSMAGGSRLTSEAYFTAYLKGLVDGVQTGKY
jgi:mannonate dehydratase